ncbi:MAG: HupE/UreJ family protein [Planctomycetes bacterium]|nr:HupE/UreJ family protein [Planctomycetota bacterium]
MLSLALAAALFAHPNSVSSSRITVDGARVAMELRCQERTLLESLPELDRDDDGDLVESELKKGAELVQNYVREHLILAADARESARDGARLVAKLHSVVSATGALAGALPGDELVDFVFDFECEHAPRNLAVDTTLFRESDPFHRDHCAIVWNGAEPVSRLLWVEDPLWMFQPDAAPAGNVLGAYLHLGIEHILTGYDHIAFVLALILASRRVRSLLVVVTAFTLAHSLTLASAAMGWFDLPGSVVEPVIALSIAWVGARNLFAEPPKRLWPEAFGFGLVHGLGFAGALRATLAAEPDTLRALFGVNAGVELGQLAIVASVVLLLRIVARTRAEHERATLAPAGLRRATAGVVAILGLWWFAERAFGV